MTTPEHMQSMHGTRYTYGTAHIYSCIGHGMVLQTTLLYTGFAIRPGSCYGLTLRAARLAVGRPDCCDLAVAESTLRLEIRDLRDIDSGILVKEAGGLEGEVGVLDWHDWEVFRSGYRQ